MPSRLGGAALVRNHVEAAGYVEIGIDHFAREDDPLALAAHAGGLHRNFQGYTDDARLFDRARPVLDRPHALRLRPERALDLAGWRTPHRRRPSRRRCAAGPSPARISCAAP